MKNFCFGILVATLLLACSYEMRAVSILVILLLLIGVAWAIVDSAKERRAQSISTQEGVVEWKQDSNPAYQGWQIAFRLRGRGEVFVWSCKSTDIQVGTPVEVKYYLPQSAQKLQLQVRVISVTDLNYEIQERTRILSELKGRVHYLKGEESKE